MLEHYASGGVKIPYKELRKGGAWKSEDELSLADRDREFEIRMSANGSRNGIKRKGDMDQHLEKRLQKMNAYPNQDGDGPKPRKNKETDQLWKDLYKIYLEPSQHPLFAYPKCFESILTSLGYDIKLSDNIRDIIRIRPGQENDWIDHNDTARSKLPFKEAI